MCKSLSTQSRQSYISVAAAALALSIAGLAPAKPWKGAEMITHQTFKYGAFEARIRAARGGGVITPFFLWKDGSERPGAEWQEQDFEVFGRDGTYQTQLMTPGTAGSIRTEHVINHKLPTPAWERYYTYRMEWTPKQLSFYVDGQLVRRESNTTVYQKFLDPARAEPAQLRVSIWAGDFAWSGAFDSSAVPATVFVNWMRALSYTPGAGADGSDFTELWRDDFESDSGRFWRANWTFEHAVNDYVPENAALRDGYLVLVLTDETSTGQFPAVPVDDGQLTTPTPPPTTVAVPGRIEAEAYNEFHDSTAANLGASSCSSTAVDAELTRDPKGGNCNVGWTAPGEWLEYAIRSPSSERFDIVLRASSAISNRRMHVEVDGVDVSGPITVPATGWQSFHDLTVAGILIANGSHIVRLAFDTGDVNVNFVDFVRSVATPPPTTCSPLLSTYQAETMRATVGGPASGGWNLWGNGSLSTSHAFIGGSSIVTVRAYGQKALSIGPHMVVRVGDQLIGEVVVAANTYTNYEFFFDAPSASAPVSVSFDNDYYQAGEDRNLYIDHVSIEECLGD